MKKTILISAAAVLAGAIVVSSGYAIFHTSKQAEDFGHLHAGRDIAAASTEAADDLFVHHAGHGHAGASLMLGTGTSAGFELTARQVGTLEPGHMGTFTLQMAGAELPRTVRAWVGPVANPADQSVKSEISTESLARDGHVHLTPAANVALDRQKLWVEYTDAGGDVRQLAFDLHEDE